MFHQSVCGPHILRIQKSALKFIPDSFELQDEMTKGLVFERVNQTLYGLFWGGVGSKKGCLAYGIDSKKQVRLAITRKAKVKRTIIVMQI